MKNKLTYLLFALSIFAISCDFEENVKDAHINSGTADFTTYVALGNSLTAGYQDGAVYRSGQENSYPALIAKGMNLPYTFNQPLMADDLGGIPNVLNNRYILTLSKSGLAPTIMKGEGKTTLANIYKEDKPFHNLGVSGAKVGHLLLEGYGNPAGLTAKPRTANPYFVRFTSSPNTSVVDDALKMNPTFFSLWIGNNDVLGYATTGGDDSDPLTSSIDFAKYYTALIQGLTQNGAKGVIANIPYVTSIPFFNTIPNDALKLDKEKAGLLTQFFDAIQQGFTQQLKAKGLHEQQAKALASQYGIAFHEGNNRFLIQTEKTTKNPLGFRQMAKEELLVLTIDRNAMANEGYGSVRITPELLQIFVKVQQGKMPTPKEIQTVFSAINPIQDKDVLDAEELAEIRNLIDAYNKTIADIAKQYDLALFDANSLMQTLATTGLRINGVNYNSEFIKGGVFSLDGVHPNQRGYAIIANAFIDAINQKYNANIAKVDPNNYKGVEFP
ncbi:MAG: SGNH/GDSL hydrolase family protein [Flavobacteriaceae bacterium]|nr:SGNH/GDSL hydrolase family protein [Flavobacteriaceae bacterium]